jgi:hypothetical protein
MTAEEFLKMAHEALDIAAENEKILAFEVDFPEFLISWKFAPRPARPA